VEAAEKQLVLMGSILARLPAAGQPVDAVAEAEEEVDDVFTFDYHYRYAIS
jgi:hypothetical protein